MDPFDEVKALSIPVSRQAFVPWLVGILLMGVVVVATIWWKSDPFASLCQPDSTDWLFGNTFDVLSKQNHRLHDWLAEQTELFNGRPWLLRMVGRPSSIFVATPDYYECVLKTHADAFQRGPVVTNIVRDFFGEGILSVDGAKWFFQRKTASHLFSLQMMKNVMHDAIHEKTRRLHQVLIEHAQQSQPFDLKELLCQFTSEVFAKVGFGIEMNCLRGPAPRAARDADVEQLIDALAECNRMIARRISQPIFLWKLKRWLNIGDEKTFRESLQIANMWTTRIIEASMAAKNQPNAAPSKDLISLFLDSKVAKEVNVEQDDVQVIRDMVINFVFAGKDTTSQAMSWFFVMVNKYPHIVTKLREELGAKLPGLRDGSVSVPTMEDLKELVYLEATIRENLRLNPPVPASNRTAMEDVVLHDGTLVPAGTRVAMSSYASARLTSVWGKNAREFKPERWIDANGQLITVSPFKFQAFLAGPRICLGIKFAMLEMKMVLAVLISAFDIRLTQNPDNVTYELGITLAVKGELPATVHVR